MLGRADANNDGNISREEFLAHPTEMFARLDTNGDGVISTAERPQRPNRGERRERANPDTNNDGQLSQAEFAAIGASMFQRLDANSDGRVTRDEAAAAHPHRRGRD
jgi:Ca2+-binding EF-hand superfamily protein